MPWIGVQPGEDDCPRHGAWAPDDLRVEEVPDPDAGGGHRCGYCHPIQQPKHVSPRASSEKPHREGDPQNAPVAREATAPDRQDFERVAEVVCRLVQQTVSQARADDRACHHIAQQAAGLLSRAPRLFEAPDPGSICGKNAGSEQQTVPADLDQSDVQQDGVDVPFKTRHSVFRLSDMSGREVPRKAESPIGSQAEFFGVHGAAAAPDGAAAIAVPAGEPPTPAAVSSSRAERGIFST